ncbi:MAG: hypothetical protein V1723_04690 [Candidatus Uhrbacteria bacterium]
MRPRIIAALRTIAVIAVVGFFGLWLANVGSAVVWQEPAEIPPAGNLPGFIWSRSSAGDPQPGAHFNIAGSGRIGADFSVSGMAQFGSALLDLGNVSGGQNLIYGVAKRSAMNEGDALLLLQTAADTGLVSDRLRVDRGGNLSVDGDLRVRGCAGPVVVASTQETSGGNLGGYKGANGRCNAAVSGSHLCSVEETLRSISCGALDDASTSGKLSASSFWIAAGPPGYVANANDCSGWTSADATQLGPFWRYNAATGGVGFLSSCNVTKVIGCCL